LLTVIGLTPGDCQEPLLTLKPLQMNSHFTNHKIIKDDNKEMPGLAGECRLSVKLCEFSESMQ